MTIRTGIGGWTYPDWRGGMFYPKGLRQADELAYAAQRLGAIEINARDDHLDLPMRVSSAVRRTPTSSR